MNFRLVIQPVMASVLAIRAGLKDARDGRPPFLWAAITNRAYRPELLRQGSRDVRNVFALAVALDGVYQFIVQRGVYVLELLVVPTLLAIVPYIIIRGPVNRLARALRRQRDRGEWPTPQGRTT